MQGLQSRRPHSWRLIVSFVAAAAVLSTSLSACTTPISGSADSTASSSNKLQAPTEESPSGEITIWDRSGDLFGVFENTIADFNKKYPNIKVHHEAVDIDAKLQNTLITGTDVPDGVFLDDAKVSAFTDHLWDLSDVLNPYIKDISKQKVDVNRKGDGIYGVPFDLNPGLLYYNEKALKAAGIDPTTIKTYDDLLKAAKDYKAFKPDAAPIHIERAGFLSQLQLEMYASQLGTSLGDSQGKLRLDSAEYRQILTWLDTVNKEGLGTRTEYLDATDVAELENGNEVFYPWAIWYSFAPEQMLKETRGDWRAMELPAWKSGGARSGAMGGSSFVLPKNGKNSQLAWLFYKFLMFDKDGYSKVWGTSSTYPNGLTTSIPSYLPAADPKVPLFTPTDALGKQDLWAVATEAGSQIPGGTPIPSWWTGAVDYLGTNIQLMYDGKLSVDEVITNSSNDIQKNLVDRQ